MNSRRRFLANAGFLAAGALEPPALNKSAKTSGLHASESVSLCGEWSFRTDPEKIGQEQLWYKTDDSNGGWRNLRVPHTWQVESDFSSYRGVAWYRRVFEAPREWQDFAVRVEFEAVFHTATVWINGGLAGKHERKGYTAFTLDIAHLLYWGVPNTICVRVDSSFDDHMLPRGRSSDWAHDGGIYRPLQLHISPKTFIERVDVNASPNLASGDGNLEIFAYIRNVGLKSWTGRPSFRVIDQQTGLTALTSPDSPSFTIKSGEAHSLKLHATLPKAKLWHFDQPNLYQLVFSIANGQETHRLATAFGVRKFVVDGPAFCLNGERVRLMGVERMAGSNPEFGMAEPSEWIAHDMDDLKRLNCVFTRVHWPQDRRILDYCDAHGILLQSEIPAWGWETFKGTTAGPDPDILQNGLEQLREMIARDRNHPCVVAWGLCNEIDGQNPAAYQFAKRMLAEAKTLDPGRPCSYASNSLRKTPERDIAGLMDFIEVNEYFGTWEPGTVEMLSQHLDALHAAFPEKPIVISEFGYCACAPERPEGDSHRREVLQSHDVVFRSKGFVAGTIFFDYNDYRSQVGASGVGALQQNVHGVVDVYGRRKPSYQVLRDESSPVETFKVENISNAFHIRVKNRGDLPAYTLRGYRLRVVYHGEGDIPLEAREIDLPEMAPGSEAVLELKFAQTGIPFRILFDVLRPNRFSAYRLDWKL